MNRTLIFLLSLTCSIAAPVAVAGQTDTATLSDHIAVGSWYGRALPDDPASAPVPEMIMLASFFSDGTLIANDAMEEIIRHGTAHGHWQKTGKRTSQATFIWLNLNTDNPTGFAGTFKVIMDAFVHPDDPDKMGGTLEVWSFPPEADPLDPENTGATPLGTFTVDTLVRIQCDTPATVQQNRAADLSVGSWYGRALPDDPANAPLPEVIMMPTFYADGNLIANDAVEMLIRHGTAHGHWVQLAPNQIEGTFIWLNLSDEIPNGFAGAFKVLFTGIINPDDPDKMGGTLDAWLFPPGTDPLDPDNTGAVPLGRFTIEELIRVRPGADPLIHAQQADPSVGTWLGRAVSDDPANAPVPELVMIPTFGIDGSLIANHATEASLLHGTGHGAWTRTGDRISGTFIWINLSADVPNGFAGSYKINLDCRVDPDNPDTMAGTLEAWAFPPDANPLNPHHTGAIPLGTFTIESLARITHNPRPAPTAVEQADTEPLTLALDAIYPNPFNPQTSVAFTLPADTAVRLEVFNNQGQLVRRLADGRLAAGRFTAVWDGTNDQGQSVASGLYLFRLASPTTHQVKKATLLK